MELERTPNVLRLMSLPCAAKEDNELAATDKGMNRLKNFIRGDGQSAGVERVEDDRSGRRWRIEDTTELRVISAIHGV